MKFEGYTSKEESKAIEEVAARLQVTPELLKEQIRDIETNVKAIRGLDYSIDENKRLDIAYDRIVDEQTRIDGQ